MIISRLNPESAKVNHSLAERWVVKSLKHSKKLQPLTDWRTKTSSISGLEMKQAVADSHSLETQEEVSSAGLNHSKL
jgi:hypothetical protein